MWLYNLDHLIKILFTYNRIIYKWRYMQCICLQDGHQELLNCTFLVITFYSHFCNDPYKLQILLQYTRTFPKCTSVWITQDTMESRVPRLNVHTNQILAHIFSHGTLDSVVS